MFVERCSFDQIFDSKALAASKRTRVCTRMGQSYLRIEDVLMERWFP